MRRALIKENYQNAICEEKSEESKKEKVKKRILKDF